MPPFCKCVRTILKPRILPLLASGILVSVPSNILSFIVVILNYLECNNFTFVGVCQ